MREFGVHKKIKDKWYIFFKQFTIIRNCIHNNFIARRDCDDGFPNDWYSWKIEKDRPIILACSVMKSVTERYFNFFNEVDPYLQHLKMRILKDLISCIMNMKK